MQCGITDVEGKFLTERNTHYLTLTVLRKNYDESLVYQIHDKAIILPDGNE
jgi:hypothetical protein